MYPTFATSISVVDQETGCPPPDFLDLAMYQCILFKVSVFCHTLTVTLGRLYNFCYVDVLVTVKKKKSDILILRK